MKQIRIAVILLTVAAMLISWPICPIRQVQEKWSGYTGYTVSEPLAAGEQAVQRFRASDNNMISLEFVVDYDDAAERSGHLLFELLDADEEVLYSEMLDYGTLPSYTYTGAEVGQELKWGKMYSYRLTNIDITVNQPCIVYTVDAGSKFLWSDKLTVGGMEIDGEALTRITANSPLPWADRLSIWGCIGVVGFSISELLGRLTKTKQENEALR